MKLFEMKDWELTIEEQSWALGPFKKLLDKDKSKNKERAVKEMSFVWFFCDLKSNYQYITNEEERAKELKKDLKLPSAWKITDDIQAAIDFYKDRSKTVSSEILRNSIYTANKLSQRMKDIVDSEDLSGVMVTKLLEGLKKMPDLIKSLQETEKAVLKEIAQNKRNVGSQEKALFEDGFEIE